MRTLTYRDLIDQSVSELLTVCHPLWLADADEVMTVLRVDEARLAGTM